MLEGPFLGGYDKIFMSGIWGALPSSRAGVEGTCVEKRGEKKGSWEGVSGKGERKGRQ